MAILADGMNGVTGMPTAISRRFENFAAGAKCAAALPRCRIAAGDLFRTKELPAGRRKDIGASTDTQPPLYGDRRTKIARGDFRP
jgi:hypothetical protein